MSRNDYPGVEWRKSRYSNGQAECVEVARNLPGIVAVRDSKDPAALRSPSHASNGAHSLPRSKPGAKHGGPGESEHAQRGARDACRLPRQAGTDQ